MKRADAIRNATWSGCETVSEKIDALAERLPASIDPQLRHFLERCSYSKALALLEGASVGA